MADVVHMNGDEEETLRTLFIADEASGVDETALSLYLDQWAKNTIVINCVVDMGRGWFYSIEQDNK